MGKETRTLARLLKGCLWRLRWRSDLRFLTKEKAECWTRWRASAQVSSGSDIQLLPFSLVSVKAAHWYAFL
jgi:hypothetical protein